MKPFRLIIPVVLIVGIYSWMKMEKDFAEVPETSRILITIGAVIVSGIISYFLFPKNEGEEY
ncbi:histidine kinase [Sporosarcina siberiensis]|uniref:Histidine kinase n=1 Tax=Sporosarcina siberiensis TaxID=1365606 RepID=A0ABW4SK56_9BACL